MADCAITARQTVAKSIKDLVVGALRPFITAEKGKFSKAQVTKARNQHDRLLAETHNPIDPANGMSGLLSTTANPVRDIQSSVHVTDTEVLQDPTNQIDEQEAAQKRADELNLQNFHVLGAKQGSGEGLETIFGKNNVRDMYNPNGTKKGIDEYHLHQLWQNIVRNATPLSYDDKTKLIQSYAGQRYNFKHSFQQNYDLQEELRVDIEANDVILSKSIIVANLMSNMERASTETWGASYLTHFRTLRATIEADGYIQEQETIDMILRAAREADNLRNFELAPDEGEMANNIEDLIALAAREPASRPARPARGNQSQRNQAQGQSQGNQAQGQSQGNQAQGGRQRRGRSRSRFNRRPEVADYRDHPCKHCKKHKRTLLHPNINEDKCFYNKKYKGWRPSAVINDLNAYYGINLEFKGRNEFPISQGGYVPDAQFNGSANAVDDASIHSSWSDQS